MNLETTGRLLLLLGIFIAGVGGALWALARLPLFGALGTLPGDLSWRRGPVTVVAPLTTMLLVSILLTVVVNILLRFLRR